MKIPPSIKAALNDCHMPYEIKRGGRHYKIYIRGYLIGVFSGTGKDRGDIGYKNIADRIKRFSEGRPLELLNRRMLG